MTHASWHYEKTDSRGFVALTDLRRAARRMTRERFVEEFPVPALLVVDRPGDSAEHEALGLPNEGLPESSPSSQGLQLLTAAFATYAILRYLNRVAFICKRPGNPLRHLVSIGRSVRNDIAIGVDSVSKVHGYFSANDQDLYFTDHSSKNGSFLNGRPVEPGQKNLLRDGDFIRMGVEVTFEYMSPTGLFDRLRSG